MNGSGQRRPKRSFAEKDRRNNLVTVRLTSAENDVVKELCARYTCSRSDLVRRLLTATMPAPMPEANVELFGMLDAIGLHLADLAEHEQHSSGTVTDALRAAEAALDRLYASLTDAS